MGHTTKTTYPLAVIGSGSHRKYRIGKQAVVGGKYLELAIVESGQTVIGPDPQLSRRVYMQHEYMVAWQSIAHGVMRPFLSVEAR